MEEKRYCYKYPHAAVTTDSVVFGFDGKNLNVLLIERGGEPYKGCWAIPGGFLNIDETVEECALRELKEETNIDNIYMEQFHVFSSVARDPRERVLTVAFLALVRSADYNIIGGDDAVKAEWFYIDSLPDLAFDHHDIITMARERLKDKFKKHELAFKLLDEKFSMYELQKLYEAINGVVYDRRNFVRKMLRCTFIEDCGKGKVIGHERCQQLYSFNEDAYIEYLKNKSFI